MHIEWTQLQMRRGKERKKRRRGRRRRRRNVSQGTNEPFNAAACSVYCVTLYLLHLSNWTHTKAHTSMVDEWIYQCNLSVSIWMRDSQSKVHFSLSLFSLFFHSYISFRFLSPSSCGVQRLHSCLWQWINHSFTPSYEEFRFSLPLTPLQDEKKKVQ